MGRGASSVCRPETQTEQHLCDRRSSVSIARVRVKGRSGCRPETRDRRRSSDRGTSVSIHPSCSTHDRGSSISICPSYSTHDRASSIPSQLVHQQGPTSGQRVPCSSVPMFVLRRVRNQTNVGIPCVQALSTVNFWSGEKNGGSGTYDRTEKRENGPPDVCRMAVAPQTHDLPEACSRTLTALPRLHSTPSLVSAMHAGVVGVALRVTGR